MVELRTRKREMRGDGTNHHEKLGLKRILCASQFTIPDMAGMSSDLECKTPIQNLPTLIRQLVRLTFHFHSYLPHRSHLDPLSLFLVDNSTIFAEHKVVSSLSISPCHNRKLTPSTAYTEYSVHPSQFLFP